MDITEIIIGIHPTIYMKNKKSFHPFFYLKLHRNGIEDFGVIIQYIKIPINVNENQKHTYEDDGVEFIEKKENDFENELRNILYYAKIKTASIKEWIITYKSSEFDPMTLRDFFTRAIPVKGVWLQKDIEPKNLKKSCMGFCIESMKNLNLKKKSIEANKIKIQNMISLLLNDSENENFQLYIKALNELLLKVIFE